MAEEAEGVEEVAAEAVAEVVAEEESAGFPGSFAGYEGVWKETLSR